MNTPTQTPAPPRAGQSPPSGSLLRAELRRIRSRRFIQLLLALALLGWLVAVAVGLTRYGTPDAADLAAARHQVEQAVAHANAGRAQCLAAPQRPAGASCGDPVTAADIPVDQFLSPVPFSLAQSGISGALGFGAVAAVLAFLIGATWIGAEWSARSIVALLFWQPRRLRVVGAKLCVLAAGSALLGVLAQAAWLAMASILTAADGDGAGVPHGFWSGLLALQGRSVLLTILAALLGFGLANLTRNTGAALGVGFVYFAVVESIIRGLRPTWQPWLLTNNAVALMHPKGLGIPLPGPLGLGREYVVSNLQAGILLGAVTAVVVVIGVVLFDRPDLH